MEDIKTKLENDPKLKDAIEFIQIKFEELQKILTTEKPSMLKMIKIAKNFTSDMEKEYKTKYDRDLNVDMKNIKDIMDYSQLDILKAFKGMGM